MEHKIAMGGKGDAPAKQRPIEPITRWRRVKVHHDQERVYRQIDEDMEDESAHRRSLKIASRRGVRLSSKAMSWAARPMPQPASTQTNQMCCGLRMRFKAAKPILAATKRAI